MLLSSRPVNAVGFHIISLIEFLQVFFLVNYSIVCLNEFGNPIANNINLDPFMPQLLR